MSHAKKCLNWIFEFNNAKGPAAEPMIDIYREIVRLQEQGQHAALATIIHTQGSTPRKAGAQMLIQQDGSSTGTISGGRIEAEVCERAKQVLETGRPQLYEARLSEEQAGALGLVCGGLIRVWIERV
jgi:xanthine dehydrogenase accessory factor